MIKLFAIKVSNFTIVTKSCILGKAGVKMNDYLTYFEAKSSNAQFLCRFAFPLFKFWIIPSPSCNLFKCTRTPTVNGTSLLWNFSMLFFTYPQTILFLLPEGSSKGALESFWHIIHLSPSMSLVQIGTVTYFCLTHTSLIHFFDKQFAKNGRILWMQNILNKLLFLSDKSKWMNKFLYCIY